MVSSPLRAAGPRRRSQALWSASRGFVRIAHERLNAPPPFATETTELPAGVDGCPVRARLYRPEGAVERLPGLIYFHGGGYTLGDIDTHDELCRWLCGLARAAVVSVDYRLAPEHRFPAQLADAETSARWVLDRTDCFGMDPARMATGGDSAGGFLAAYAAARMNEARPGAISLQLLLYPLLHVDSSACEAEALRVFQFVGRTAARIIGSHVLEPGAVPIALSPSDISGAPRTVIVSGGLDPIRSESQAYAAALKAQGTSVVELTFPRLLHAGCSFPGLFKTNLSALTEVGQVLGRCLHEDLTTNG